MLTIQVTDSLLAARLEAHSRVTGKPTEQVAQKLIAEALEQMEHHTLSFQKLDPKKYSGPLQVDIDPATDEAPAFQHIDNTISYANTLRQNAWKR